MRSIRTRIVTAILLMAVIPAVILQTVSIVSSITSSLDSANSTMAELCQSTADRIHYQLQSYINVAETAGCNPYFSYNDVSSEDKKKVLDALAASEGFERGNIIGLDGRSIFDGTNFSERDYYQKAIKGETYISDPLLSKITGKYAVIVAAPLWENGISGSTVVGCIYFAPPAEFLQEIVQSVDLSDESSVYMLNPNGTIIADKKDGTVEKQISVIGLAETEPAYANLAAVHERIIAGETGHDTYKNTDGNNILISYSPIYAPTSGWYLAMEEPVNTFFQSTLDTVIFMVLLTLGFCALAGVVAFAISKNIVRPIQACSHRIRNLSLGDVQSPSPIVKSKDEVGMLAESTEHLIYNLKIMISDIDRILSDIAKGDLSVDINLNSESYVGDFAHLQISMTKINDGLSNIITKINDASSQVSEGSEQVSCAAQSLSQGSTEQASSVDHLADTISKISANTKNNLEECEEAKAAVGSSGEHLQQANNQMHRMTEAMSRIGAASDKIEKINKTIEDIAFQTNILALNAAVEAAKVGEAGKGFAVVADEVRNLAAKSQESAKITSALIRECSAAVKDGMDITNETADTLNMVVQTSGDVVRIVNIVANSSEQQAAAIKEISIGIDQISTVVQTNSATAEESAAASQELSGQSQVLKTLVDRFTLPKRYM
ncbi:MAG: methyl-accepting chemotaxis protein [Firmicutes bacterium]|nr:methyl-accepting chemotaxis protein [[Eubacterium] siraeum]MCM1487652.1 methyl-accepting chemotaxis protein [Bacillota bacterium]